MEMETINLGVRKYEVSKQAKVLYNAFVAIFVIHILSLFMMRDIGVIGFVLQTVYLLAMGALGVYATNCIVVGKCNTYAWVIAYLYIFIAVLYGMMFVFSAWMMFTRKGGVAPAPAPTRKSGRKSRK